MARLHLMTVYGPWVVDDKIVAVLFCAAMHRAASTFPIPQRRVPGPEKLARLRVGVTVTAGSAEEQ